MSALLRASEAHFLSASGPIAHRRDNLLKFQALMGPLRRLLPVAVKVVLAVGIHVDNSPLAMARRSQSTSPKTCGLQGGLDDRAGIDVRCRPARDICNLGNRQARCAEGFCNDVFADSYEMIASKLSLHRILLSVVDNGS
jgi:hypothetical protein